MAMPRWTLARGFLVVASVLPLVYLTVLTGFDWLHFGPVPYFLIPLALIGIALAFVPNPWLALAGGIIAFAYALASTAAVATGGDPANGDPGALRPDRFFDYTFWWLTLLGGVGALAAGIALVRQRKAAAAPATRIGVAAVAICVALYIGGIATAFEERQFVPAASSVVVGTDPDAIVNLTTTAGSTWEPASFTVAHGALVKLVITNPSTASHVFDLDAANVHLDLTAGSTHEVWLKFGAPGQQQYFCSLHSSGSSGSRIGMVGTITVT